MDVSADGGVDGPQSRGSNFVSGVAGLTPGQSTAQHCRSSALVRLHHHRAVDGCANERSTGSANVSITRITLSWVSSRPIEVVNCYDSKLYLFVLPSTITNCTKFSTQNICSVVKIMSLMIRSIVCSVSLQ